MGQSRIFALALVALAMAAVPAAAFDLQGHRGARGLAPENTLAAFARALEIGVTTLETDLAVTKDGVLVLSHDPVLNPDIVRGADDKWLSAPGPAVNTLTLAEIKRFDVGRLDPSGKYAGQFPGQKAVDGERIPALEELFELVRRSGKAVRFNIETKLSPETPAQTPDPDTFVRLVVEASCRRPHAVRRHPVIRLAHAARGKEARPRDRNRLPDLREDPARQGRGQRPSPVAVARRHGRGRPWRLRPTPRGGCRMRDMVACLPRAERGHGDRGACARPQGRALDGQCPRGHGAHYRHEG